jgi:5-methylcytosine-specific restriction enzyme A
MKHRLAVRDGGAMCHYCLQWGKIYDLTVDHVIPRSHGGSDALANLVLACWPCNRAKGDLAPAEFQAVAS